MTYPWVLQPKAARDEVLDIIAAFEKLNDGSAVFMDPRFLELEQEKLRLIQDFEKIFLDIVPQNFDLIQKKNPGQFVLSLTYREILYYFILIFGLFESVAGSYLFGSTLFDLIPGVSALGHMMLSTVFTFLDGIFFYAFEVTFLKDALGIPYDRSDFMQHLETYTGQLNTTIQINQALATIHMLNVDDDTYDEFINFTHLLNEDLYAKQALMSPYPQSMWTYILKIVVLVYGAISNAAGSYFFSNAILSTAAASLVGTPLGWSIVVLTMLCGLGFYYAMGGTGIINLVTPGLDQYQALQAGLDAFKPHYQDHIGSIELIRGQFKRDKPKYFGLNKGLLFQATDAAQDKALDLSEIEEDITDEVHLPFDL